MMITDQHLQNIKDAARYQPIGDGYFDTYGSTQEAVDAAVEELRKALAAQPRDDVREAFKAGWRTNAVGEDVQPASYLDGSEQTDWEEYQRVGINAYCTALAPTTQGTTMTEEWCINMAKAEGDAEIGAGMPDHPLRAPSLSDRERVFANEPYDPPCSIPPKGWRCTRKPGHEGPCAAIPETDRIDTQGTDSGLAGEVTQADREAAVRLIAKVQYPTEYLTEIEDGSYDENYFVQAFARHRVRTDRKAVLEEAAFAARDALCDMEWPPEDGDRQIDEVMAAIRALAKESTQ